MSWKRSVISQIDRPPTRPLLGWIASAKARQLLGMDQICREERISAIDFLKMNIEGAEVFALLGMRETIKSSRNVCVCCHDFRAERGHGDQYRTRNFVELFLTGAGFRLSFNRNAPYDFLRDHIYGERG